MLPKWLPCTRKSHVTRSSSRNINQSTDTSCGILNPLPHAACRLHLMHNVVALVAVANVHTCSNASLITHHPSPVTRQPSHPCLPTAAGSNPMACERAAMCCAECLGFGVWGLWFGVWWFGVWGLGFGVWGLGIEAWGSRNSD